MTKLHFEKLAAIVATIDDVEMRTSYARDVADVCAASNSRFDRTRFYEACNVNTKGEQDSE